MVVTHEQLTPTPTKRIAKINLLMVEVTQLGIIVILLLILYISKMLQIFFISA